MPPNTVQPGTRIRAYLAELLQISPAEIRGAVIPLQASLSNTTPLTDTYKVPSDQDLFIFSISGYMRMPTLNSEPTAILTWLNLDPSERFLLKAANCIVQLENTDRQWKLCDGREVVLGSIMPPLGMPLQWPVELPYTVPAGHNLKATFTLQDSTSAIVGNATVYGVNLIGALIPKKD